MTLIRNLDPAYAFAEKPRVFEFKEDGTSVPDTLDSFEKQLALSLIHRDEMLMESSTSNDIQEEGSFEVSKPQIPTKLLEILHKHLSYSYGEVEVMYDLLQRLIKTRLKDAEVPQQLTLLPSVPPTSQPKDQEKLLNIAYKYKKERYLAICFRFRSRSKTLMENLDMDDKLLSNIGFPLKEAGWAFGRRDGRLAVRYGVTEDQSVIVSDIKIPDSHKDMILEIKWNINQDLKSMFAEYLEQFDNGISSMEVDCDDVETVLASARQSVMDELLFTQINADTRNLPLALVKGSSIIYPINSNINISLTMKKRSDCDSSLLSAWTRAMCRFYFVTYQREMKKFQSRMIYEAEIHTPPVPNSVLSSLLDACKLLCSYVETRNLVSSMDFGSLCYKFTGWPADCNAKSFRLTWFHNQEPIARIMKFKSSAPWQVAIRSDQTWNVSDLTISTKEALDYVYLYTTKFN